MSNKNYMEIKEEICEIGKRMYDREMVATNDGNISVKIDDDTFVITPTGVSKGYMTPDIMCIVNKKGELKEENGPWKGTSEFKLHAKIFELRPDVGAVVHAHPMYATAFACSNQPLNKKLNTETILGLGEVPILKYGLPGTTAIADDLENYTEYHDAFLMESHGAVACGPSLLEAYYKMESLEFCAKQTFIIEQLGTPNEIGGDRLKELYKLRRGFDAWGPHHIAFKPENLD